MCIWLVYMSLALRAAAPSPLCAHRYELLKLQPGEYISEMVRLMRPYMAVRGDTLYRHGQRCEEVFFIDDEGEVDILWEEDLRVVDTTVKRKLYAVTSLCAGQSFGDEGLLEDRLGQARYLFTAR